MHHLMEPVIILHTEPMLTVPMDSVEALVGASAEASAEALAEASAVASAEASAEEDGGGKPENPALRAALEHQDESKAAASKRACKAYRGLVCLMQEDS
jgi:hypothetical protein